ncbi:cytochrome c oxidase subunit 1 [Cichlidogyrus casuarinus]|uniref:peptidylprolyl isomerase n=1 Tax=Cichlidogyrus casuarinus TaxID=1844966 RepID=A0ABD2QFK4_9PLAT
MTFKTFQELLDCTTIAQGQTKDDPKRIIDGTICKLMLKCSPKISINGVSIDEEYSLFCHIFGSCPDLSVSSKLNSAKTFNSLLHIIESQLYGMAIEAEKFMLISNGGIKYMLHMLVEGFIKQPEFRPTLEVEDNNRVDSAGEKLEVPIKQISAWNHCYSALLYSRACALKERGNSLFSELNTSANQETCLLKAHACYHRALELIQSLNLACCFPKHEILDVNDFNAIEEIYQRDYAILPNLLGNSFKLEGINTTFDNLPGLEFKVLLNLAACHLRAGANQQAVDQCTKALELRPVNDAVRMLITNKDLSKAYFRRGQAYQKLKELDDAEKNFKISVELSDADDVVAAEQSLQSVRKEIQAVQQEMKMRLKKLYS